MQNLIDLMPEDLRQQSQAGARKGQMLIAFTLAGALVVALATHSTLERNRKRSALEDARVHADRVLQLDQTRAAIAEDMAHAMNTLREYKLIAHPLPVASVLASVVNELPESVSLDSIELDAGARRRSTSSRAPRRDKETGPAQRRLTCELAGFAVNDSQVAELVERLQSMSPLEKVSLDFTRTRMIRGQLAREFRLSFMIDLEADYTVVERHAAAEGGQS